MTIRSLLEHVGVEIPGSCRGVIRDGTSVILCTAEDGHDRDHRRGFLHWDDTGAWYTCRTFTEGRWIPGDGT